MIEPICKTAQLGCDECDNSSGSVNAIAPPKKEIHWRTQPQGRIEDK
ncbi:MAG: hypothetical protein F6K41_08725 [Symploca sp. SIO3E6]|nr:hypothetical protein [Caldora sp. SIO3E6]